MSNRGISAVVRTCYDTGFGLAQFIIMYPRSTPYGETGRHKVSAQNTEENTIASYNSAIHLPSDITLVPRSALPVNHHKTYQMKLSTVELLLVQAALTWASPHQQPLWAPSSSTFRQLEAAAIRSEVAQGVSLFCLLVDEHRFTEMDKVFTFPEVYINLPEDGFRHLTRLDTFVQNLYTYADYPFQHTIGVPVVEVEESMTVAHVTSPLIATIFDSYNGEIARPNGAEYGLYVAELHCTTMGVNIYRVTIRVLTSRCSYITDHILTNDGWRMQNMTAKPLGIYQE